MDSKTKVAGPLAAAGAISVGLVFIGAGGIGQEDIYVPPPPIHSGPQAVEQARYSESTSSTAGRVIIPPSPSWRMAPDPGPRRTLPPEYQISTTESSTAESDTTGQVTHTAAPGPAPEPEIEPAHSRSPIPPPDTGTAADETGAPAPTAELPATTEAPPTEQPPLDTEPAQTTPTPSAPAVEQPAPFNGPSGTAGATAPAATVPRPGGTIPSAAVPTIIPAPNHR